MRRFLDGAHKSGLDSLKCVFNAMAEIPDTEWTSVSSQMRLRTFGIDDMLYRAGEPVTEFHFIIKGLARYYYLTPDGKEYNKLFAAEHDFVGSFSYKIPNTPCSFYVQALEPTETAAMPVNVIIKAFDRHSAWERIGRLLAENMSLTKELREKEFLLDPAETRYRRFLKEHPSLAERLPQYHIASYLGITDVALSRIRRKLT